MLFMLATDLGWMLYLPMICVPSLIVAVCVQVRLFSAYQDDMATTHGCALLVWMAGCSVWMTAELLCESSKTHIATQHEPSVEQLSHQYMVLVAASGFVIWATLVVLLCIYVSSLRKTTLEDMATSLAASQDVRLSSHLLAKRKFRQMAEERSCSWFMPWLFMEACWVLSNLQQIRKQPLALWAPLGACGALLAVALCLQATVQQISAACQGGHAERCRATLVLAEFTLLLGNALWMLFDLACEEGSLLDRLGTILVVEIFLAGMVCAVKGFHGSIQESERVPLLKDSKTCAEPNA